MNHWSDLGLRLIRAAGALASALAGLAALLTDGAFRKRTKPLGGWWQDLPLAQYQLTRWGGILLSVILLAPTVQFFGDWMKDASDTRTLKKTATDIRKDITKTVQDESRLQQDAENKVIEKETSLGKQTSDILNVINGQLSKTVDDIKGVLGRPDIKGEHSYTVHALRAGQPVQIEVNLTNYGILDAKDLKFYYSVKLSTQAATVGPDPSAVAKISDYLSNQIENDKPMKTRDIVPAKTKFPLTIYSDFSLTQDQLERIHGGSSSLYIGLVFYYKSFAYYQNRATGHYVTVFCMYGNEDLTLRGDCNFPINNFGDYVARP